MIKLWFPDTKSIGNILLLHFLVERPWTTCHAFKWASSDVRNQIFV